MNLIISWGYEINGAAYKRMMKELDVKYCAYMTGGQRIKPFDEGIESEEINLYEDFGTYEKKALDAIPLDADLIEKMKPYEMTAMDIINRWRRSISTDESYKEIKRIYYTYLRYWNDFIITRKVNCLILFNLPHTQSNYIIYALCKVYKIPIVVQVKMATIEGGLLNKYLTTDIEGMDPEFQFRHQLNIEKYSFLEDNEIEICDGFKEYFEEYKKQNQEIKRVILDEAVMSTIDKIRLYSGRARLYISQERYKILANKIFYLMRTRVVSKRMLNYAQSKAVEPNMQQNFYFFPLHFQPEATTLPHAGVYVDQLIVIQMISACLPEGTFLYVKEHPAYWKLKERYECVSEVRSKFFYNAITRLKNVRLIRHDYSSLELIDRCECLITCTGSASLEAAFKNKPAMIFGNMCYAFMPGTYKISTIEDCSKAIDAVSSGKHQGASNRELKMFFKTLEEHAVTVGLTEGNIDDPHYDTMDVATSGERTADAMVKFVKRLYPQVL